MRRFSGVVLFLAGLGWLFSTGQNLRDAFALEEKLDGQVNYYADRALETSNGMVATIAGTGVFAISNMAARVREREHEDEIKLACAAAVCAIGLFLALKRKSQIVAENQGDQGQGL